VGSDEIQLNLGDYVQIVVIQNTGSTQNTINQAVFSNVKIERLSGPAVVAATESVNASYTNTSGQSFNAGTRATLTNWTKVFDSHNAFNASTGIYTVPVSGTYQFVTQVNLGSSGASSGITSVVEFAKNAVNNGTNSFARGGGNSFAQYSNHLCIGIVKLLAGDQVYIGFFNGTNVTQVIDVDATQTYISVVRVGN
jgi:hypothetical protein